MRPTATNTGRLLAFSGMSVSLLALLGACGSGSSTTLPSTLTPTPASSPIVSELDPKPPQVTLACANADTFKSSFTGSNGSNYLIEVDLAVSGCITGDAAFSFTVSAPFLTWSDSAAYLKPSGEAQATIALVRPTHMGQGLEGSSIVVVYSPQAMKIDRVTVIGNGSPIELHR